MNSSAFPFLLLVLAGTMNGSFTLPMKFTRNWAWENTWLAWTLAALFLFPVFFTILTVPGLGEVYAESGAEPILRAATFGAGWGVSQVFSAWRWTPSGSHLRFPWCWDFRRRWAA